MKMPSIPDEVLKKVEELAKIVAKKDMAASIAISDDHDGEEEEEDFKIEDDYDEDHHPHKKKKHKGKKDLFAAVGKLLDEWEIRDPDEDAGRYYQELKEAYEKCKDEV